jgi:energy-coupling factor transporter ATP-binding protein EcfA2
MADPPSPQNSPDPAHLDSVPLVPQESDRRSLRHQRLRQWANYLGLSGSGVGIVAAIALLQQGLWLEAAVAIGVTVGLTALVIIGQFARQLTDRILDKIEERLESRIDPLATWIVDGLERAVVGLWWQIASPIEQRYCQQLIYRYRDLNTQGLRTRGPFALDLERVFVPLRVAPDSINQIPATLIRQPDNRASLDIWSILSAFNTSSFRRLVIIGAPGSGKSTLLEHLTLTYAQRRQRRYHPNAPKRLPILLYLRDLREAIAQDPALDLAVLWEQQPDIQPLNPPTRWMQRQLQHGRCLVMLDGLDEVADPSQRQAVSQWVDHQMQGYPNATFIVTSRPYGYRSAPLSRVGTLLDVQPFNLKQVQQFIQNWYFQNERMRRLGNDDPGVRATAQRQATDLIDRIRRNAPLAAMATNPLLLTMIATVHCFRGALPGRRVELYAEICDVLLGRRQDSKGIHGSLTAVQKKSVLQVLALNRMRHRSEEFSIVTGGLVIQKQVDAVAGDALYPEEFIRSIEMSSGLLVEERTGTYKFAHRSFLEYLAAVQVKELNQSLLLTRNIDDPWWEETIRLYAALQDASDLVWAALQRQTVQSLSLAYDCMREALSLSDRPIRQQLEATLEQGLESQDPDRFRLAVEVKISRRLKTLVRVDEDREVDASLVTAAEYQLFIDEQVQSGSRRYPDHWLRDRFPPGTAQDPVRGIRGQDAVAFCQWLTYRISHLGDLYLEGDLPVFVGGVQLRLPTLEEAQLCPPVPGLACWVAQDGRIQLHGISDDQRMAWLLQLQQAGDRDTDAILALTQQLKIPPLRLSRPSRHATRPRDREVALSRERDRAFLRLLTEAMPLEQDVARAFALDALPDLDPSQDPALKDEINHVGDRQRALLTSLTYAKTHSLILVSDRTLEHHHDLAFLRAYTPLVAILWHDLATLHHNLARKPRLRPFSPRSQGLPLAQTYQAHCAAAFNLYAFWVLLDERRSGRLPVWEGLRIARDQRGGS